MQIFCSGSFTQLSDIWTKQHLRERHLREVGKWLYWQPILTKPNLWAGLTQLITFPPRLAYCLSPSPSLLRVNVVRANVTQPFTRESNFALG